MDRLTLAIDAHADALTELEEAQEGGDLEDILEASIALADAEKELERARIDGPC